MQALISTMTFEDFIKVTQHKNAFDRYWHYFVAISFGLFCLVGIYYITFIDPEKFRHVRYVAYPGFLLILAMALSAFRLLPNRYKIVEIDSSLAIDLKHKLAYALISEYCRVPFEPGTNYIVCNLKKRWWQSRYIIHFYFDQYRFAFSLQGHDWDGGWIDFGETESKRRKIKASLEKLIY